MSPAGGVPFQLLMYTYKLGERACLSSRPYAQRGPGILVKTENINIYAYTRVAALYRARMNGRTGW